MKTADSLICSFCSHRALLTFLAMLIGALTFFRAHGNRVALVQCQHTSYPLCDPISFDSQIQSNTALASSI